MIFEVLTNRKDKSSIEDLIEGQNDGQTSDWAGIQWEETTKCTNSEKSSVT